VLYAILTTEFELLERAITSSQIFSNGQIAMFRQLQRQWTGCYVRGLTLDVKYVFLVGERPETNDTIFTA